MISRAISLLTETVDEETTNDGKGLIGATALVYAGLAVSLAFTCLSYPAIPQSLTHWWIFTAQYNHRVFRVITMFRGAIVSLIYNQTLEMNADAYDFSSSVTLMSTDIDRIISSLELVNEVWANVVQIGIGIWLLERQLGSVCVAPIVIVLGILQPNFSDSITQC